MGGLLCKKTKKNKTVLFVHEIFRNFGVKGMEKSGYEGVGCLFGVLKIFCPYVWHSRNFCYSSFELVDSVDGFHIGSV